MAEIISIRDNDSLGALTPGDIVNDTIFVSQEYNNAFQSNLYKGIELTVDFNNLVSDGAVQFQVVLEGKTSTGKWRPRAYSFDAFFYPDYQLDDVIVLYPNVIWLDAGIPDHVYVGNRTIAKKSPQQGTLPEAWRVVIKATVPNGNTSFVSIDIDIDAELTHKE